VVEFTIDRLLASIVRDMLFTFKKGVARAARSGNSSENAVYLSIINPN